MTINLNQIIFGVKTGIQGYTELEGNVVVRQKQGPCLLSYGISGSYACLKAFFCFQLKSLQSKHTAC